MAWRAGRFSPSMALSSASRFARMGQRWKWPRVAHVCRVRVRDASVAVGRGGASCQLSPVAFLRALCWVASGWLMAGCCLAAGWLLGVCCVAAVGLLMAAACGCGWSLVCYVVGCCRLLQAAAGCCWLLLVVARS